MLTVNAIALPAAAQDQSSCDDESQQLATQQQQVAADQAEAESSLAQIAPLVASGPGELLIAASQGALPGITPDAASSFGAIVVQIGAQIAAWQAANTRAGASEYLQDLGAQLQTWQSQYAALGPVQGEVPSLVQLSSVFAQLEQTVGKAQGDLALFDNLQQQLQQCQADANPAPEPTPPPDEALPDQDSALCSVGGVRGTSASQCFTLETDAAYAVWAACTEQYFAAEADAFRTGGDLPENTCDPAWNAAQDAIQQRWGTSQP